MKENKQEFLIFLEKLQSIFHCYSKNKFLKLNFFNSPIGQMCHISNDNHLYVLEFINRKHIEDELIDLCKRLECNIDFGETDISKEIDEQLNEYFDGKRQIFTIPTFIIGTPFQKSVWQALMDIPFGETWSYKKQAEIIGNSKAVRAVARTNGQNRISIIFPCHRVIGSNGTLTGYAGGLERKKWLLNHEVQYK